jgi:hypothetical protein
MQRKSDRCEDLKNPVMVSFKTDLTSKFYDLVGKEMKSIGAHYFAHNLIKNCFQEGHTTSSFHTNLDWQEKYWQKYWDCDPVIFTSYPIAKINGQAIVSWKIADPDSDCMEDKKTICKMNDGFFFSIQHDNGILENFSFGWEKYNTNQVNRQKLSKLSNMITSFRIQHFKLNRDMFDISPTVEFH